MTVGITYSRPPRTRYRHKLISRLVAQLFISSARHFRLRWPHFKVFLLSALPPVLPSLCGFSGKLGLNISSGRNEPGAVGFALVQLAPRAHRVRGLSEASFKYDALCSVGTNGFRNAGWGQYRASYYHSAANESMACVDQKTE